jgi:hypothetical protein
VAFFIFGRPKHSDSPHAGRAQRGGQDRRCEPIALHGRTRQAVQIAIRTPLVSRARFSRGSDRPGPVTKFSASHCRRRRKESLIEFGASESLGPSGAIDQRLLTSSPTESGARFGDFVTGPVRPARQGRPPGR